jgi:hypothetical protein
MTSDGVQMFVAHEVLDHQIIDSDDRRAGKADDVRIDVLEDGSWCVAAVCVGPSAVRQRLRSRVLRALMAWTGEWCQHVAWRDVADISEGVVKLAVPARHVGIGRTDDAMQRRMTRFLGRDDDARKLEEDDAAQ